MKLGNIQKSNKTFEQIAPAYRGKPQAEGCFTCFHSLIIKLNNIIAGYQFESFASGYLKVKKYRKLLFRSKSYSMLSPIYRSDRYFKAIDKLQAFIDTIQF
jgi:outer membrane protein assembly factor BamD